jgi:hypothetical protein
VTDSKREATYQIMTPAEFKDLKKMIDLETRLFPKALAAAAKEWQANPLNKHKAFPGGRLAPRKADVTSQFPNRDLAEKQLRIYEDREAKKLDREAAEAKKNPTAKKPGDDIERRALLDDAAQLVDGKLSELMTKDTKPAEAEAKPAEGEAKPAAGEAKPDPFAK